MKKIVSPDPPCKEGKPHDWYNPDTPWAGRQLSPHSPTVTYVRYCTRCGIKKTLESPVQTAGGYVTDDRVTYEIPDPLDEDLDPEDFHATMDALEL